MISKTVHFKKDEKLCACGADPEFFTEGGLTTKPSDVTCPECLNVVHVDFRFTTRWEDNICSLWVYKRRKKVGGGKLACGKSMMSFIYDVHVLPEYRRLGLGARIVRELVRRNGLPVSLKAAPYKACPKDTLVSVEDLFKFYERLGFVKTGICSNMICIVPGTVYTIITGEAEIGGFPGHECFVKGHEEIRSKESTVEKALVEILKKNKRFFGLEFENVSKPKC